MDTVLFGGYERSAVEKKFAELSEQAFRLENELHETEQLLAALENGKDAKNAADKILKDEREKLTKLQALHDAADQKVKVLEKDIAERDQEIAELKSKLKKLQRDYDNQSLKITAMEAQGDHEALDAAIAKAQQSADSFRDTAQKDAEALEANSKKLADNLITEANNTVKQLIYEAEKKSAEMLVDAAERSAQIGSSAESFRASALAEVDQLAAQVKALQQVFESFRTNGSQALADTDRVLNQTREHMKNIQLPQSDSPVINKPEIPQAPTPEHVTHQYYTEQPEPQPETKTEPEQAPDAKPAAKPAMSDELKRLQAMADSLVSGVKKEPEKKTEEKKKEKAKKDDQIKSLVPDLAALAAQADALANGRK